MEEGFECEIRVDGARLGQVTEFKYLRSVLESGTDVNEYLGMWGVEGKLQVLSGHGRAVVIL